MNDNLRIAAAAVVAAMTLIFACPAAALATRTFVATAGSDAGACSLSAPCRSFGAAMSQTSAGGEIVVLDSGGYGKTTITQSVTITAPDGVYAGISVAAGDIGVTVNAPGASVVLRGLSINGQGGAAGISLVGAERLRVERCHVSSMTDSGIIAQLTAFSKLFVSDSVISDNANSGIRAQGPGGVSLASVRIAGNGGFGVLLQDGPDASLRDVVVERNRWGVAAIATSADVHLDIRSSRVFANSFHGIWVNAPGGGVTLVSVVATDSEIVQNNQALNTPSAGVFAQATLGNSVRVSLERSNVSYNNGAGVYVQLTFPSGTASSTGYLSHNVVQGNTGFGVTAVTLATIYTNGNNTIENNAGGDVNGSVLAYPGPN